MTPYCIILLEDSGKPLFEDSQWSLSTSFFYRIDITQFLFSHLVLTVATTYTSLIAFVLRFYFWRILCLDIGIPDSFTSISNKPMRLQNCKPMKLVLFQSETVFLWFHFAVHHSCKWNLNSKSRSYMCWREYWILLYCQVRLIFLWGMLKYYTFKDWEFQYYLRVTCIL